MRNTKNFQLITFFLLFSCISFSQQDSIYFYNNNKLISDIKIVTPEGDIGIRENYSYFKKAYWLYKTDTILMSEIRNEQSSKKGDNHPSYSTFGQCDSIINYVRNRATYHSSSAEIRDIAGKAIGRKNKTFDKLIENDRKVIVDIHLQCADDFNTLIHHQETIQKNKIEEIKRVKIDFFNYLKTQGSSIESHMIEDFLLNFNECEIDFQSIELIILNNPQVFMNLINQMTEKSFHDLVKKVRAFPNSIDTKTLKKNIKNTENQTSRNQILQKSIKN